MGQALDNHAVHGKPPGRRERKKLDTRRKIFSAAFKLFRERGFEATTVEEIAEWADVAKGTVFNYFPQKTAFLMAAYQEWVHLIQEELGPVESWAGPVRARLERVFDHLTDLAVDHRVLARQVIFENMRQTHLRMTAEERGTPAEAGAPTEGGRGEGREPEGVRLLESMTRQVVQEGIESAEIRRDVDVEQAASLIATAAFHTVVRGLVQERSAAEIKQVLAGKMDIIFTGLTP